MLPLQYKKNKKKGSCHEDNFSFLNSSQYSKTSSTVLCAVAIGHLSQSNGRFFRQQMLQEVLKRLIASTRQVLSSWSCTPVSRNILISPFLVKKLPMPLFFSAAWASGTLRTEGRNLPCLELLQAPAQCRSSAEQPELQELPVALQRACSVVQAHFQAFPVQEYAVQCQA